MIETIAGGATGPVGDGGPALEAELYSPDDVRVGPDGLVYIADSRHGVIRRITADGLIETFAGGGKRPVDREPIPAREANLTLPAAMAFAPDGTLYFVDRLRILRVGPDGLIRWFAGRIPEEGFICSSGFGRAPTCNVFDPDGPATEVFLGTDLGITVDERGNVYVAALTNHVVRKISPDGAVTTIAGTGVADLSADGDLGTRTPLWAPSDVEVDSGGDVYIVEGLSSARRIRRLRSDGGIETYLEGGGIPQGEGFSSPDGTVRQQAMTDRAGARIDLDAEGSLYWWERGAIRRVVNDTVETVLEPDPEASIFISATFVVDPAGDLLFIDRDRLVRSSSEGRFTIVAGLGPRAARGDGGLALEARIGEARGLAVGKNGQVFLVDQAFQRVRSIMPDGTIQRVAGTGEIGSAGDGGDATEATLWSPVDVAVDSGGSLYIAERTRIRKVNSKGIISAFAGTVVAPCSSSDDCGDGGPATEAVFGRPEQVEVDGQGNVYVLDSRAGVGGRVRKITPDGIIHALDLVSNVSNEVHFNAMTLDSQDNLVVSVVSNGEDELWSVTPEGNVSPVAEASGFLGSLVTVAVDRGGNTYFVNRNLDSRSCNLPSIKRMTPDGILNTIAGGFFFPSCYGFAGDGGPAEDALLGRIAGLAVDEAGNLYVSDHSRIRKINGADQCAVIKRPLLASRGFRHGASFLPTGLVPGLIFSIFGRDLGAESSTGAQLRDGRLSTELAGTRVLIDGLPAPMLFSSGNQISAIVPYRTVGQADIFGRRHSILEVEYEGVRSEPFRLLVNESNPAIFTLDSSGSGQGAILNQDHSLNGPGNPAPLGSVIVLFATGEGLLEPPGVDGTIAASPLPRPIMPLSVLVNGIEADVLYAGAAPGLVLGVLQVNARVPESVRLLSIDSVQLRVGTVVSPRVQVFLGQ